MRTVIPGYIGARSVKWLSKITLSDRPSANYYVKDAYRLVTEGTREEWNSASILYGLPLNSATCSYSVIRQTDRGPEVSVRGYALPPGTSSRIESVEVSTNNGRTWKTAVLDANDRPCCWRLWEANVIIGPRTERILVRAIDSNWQMQPKAVPWNLKGYMFNAWHSVPVEIGQ